MVVKIGAIITKSSSAGSSNGSNSHKATSRGSSSSLRFEDPSNHKKFVSSIIRATENINK